MMREWPTMREWPMMHRSETIAMSSPATDEPATVMYAQT
jgi:hypothetical protein